MLKQKAFTIVELLIVIRYLKQVLVTLAQITRIYSTGFLRLRGANSYLSFLLLLDLDNVNAEALLSREYRGKFSYASTNLIPMTPFSFCWSIE